jgi:hypothetical protein
MAAVVDSLYRVVTAAIDDILEHGFDSQQRVDRWLEKIQLAAQRSIIPLDMLDANVRKLLTAVFARATHANRLMQVHKGVGKYTIAQISPRLHAELDKRIVSAIGMIRLNREQAMAEAARRFVGWATSIPAGGTEIGKRVKVRKDVRKSLSGLPYIERRCIIDQGMKLTAAVNEVVAADGGSIGGYWHSHWREAGYDYRPAHKARDGQFYVRRGSWADQRGYLKKGHYYDGITAAGEEVYCRCYVEWAYTLSQVPAELLTEKGREALAEARAKMPAFIGAVTA